MNASKTRRLQTMNADLQVMYEDRKNLREMRKQERFYGATIERSLARLDALIAATEARYNKAIDA